MRDQHTLFLWDIDGTLITVGGAGERALVHAIEVCFGIQGDLSGIDYSGRTDRRICMMLHDHYGKEKTEESMQRFLDVYIQQLEVEMKTSRMRVLDGILEILREIDTNPMLHQGLLTGNLAKGAEIKLTHFDLLKFFQFGAFSNLSVNRNELAGHALQEAKKTTGISFFPDHVFVIGDTPHDIECGKTIHAKTVAVATGKYSKDELAKFEPDFIFDRLGDPHDLIDQLLDY
jgi:phosphoglycolate phosphatase